jgi:hypothetical protein
MPQSGNPGHALDPLETLQSAADLMNPFRGRKADALAGR